MDIITYIVFVVIGVVIAQVVGVIWYSKFLFEKLWIKSMNKDKMLLQMEREKGMLKTILISVAGWIVATYFILNYALEVPYLTPLTAAVHALCITFAFAGATAVSNYMYENRSLVSWGIFYGYVGLVVVLQLTLFTTLV